MTSEKKFLRKTYDLTFISLKINKIKKKLIILKVRIKRQLDKSLFSNRCIILIDESH